MPTEQTTGVRDVSTPDVCCSVVLYCVWYDYRPRRRRGTLTCWVIVVRGFDFALPFLTKRPVTALRTTFRVLDMLTFLKVERAEFADTGGSQCVSGMTRATIPPPTTTSPTPRAAEFQSAAR